VARPLHLAMWVVLAAGWLWACSKDRAVQGDVRPKPPSGASRAQSAPGDDARGNTTADAANVGYAVPKGYVPVTVAGVTPTPAGAAVLLLHDASRRVVPIFVAGTDALSIELRLEHKSYARPLTHDLLDSVLSKVGATITSVRVDKLEEGTYYATIIMEFEGKRHELDARSSDAVAVALGHGAQIQMAEAILTQAGVDLDALEKSRAFDGGLTDDSRQEGAGDITL
jgi:bifunctional DNase/RNase